MWIKREKFSTQETSFWFTVFMLISQLLYANTSTQSTDAAYAFHRWFMRGCFLYVDLREAIRYEKGEQVIRLWKHWLVYFLGNNRKNYATEAMNLLCNLKCDFPAHIAYIVTHNRAVNMTGKEGCAKPLDQLIEYYNL